MTAGATNELEQSSPAPRQGATAWTGGQYSLLRVLLGAFMAGTFASYLGAPEALAGPGGITGLFLPNVFHQLSPGGVQLVLAAGVVCALLFAAGLYARAAALVLWYLMSTLMLRQPDYASVSGLVTGWLLLLQIAVPAAPYGAWPARGREDPRGDWRLPPPVYAAAWVLLVTCALSTGLADLATPSWRGANALAARYPGLAAEHQALLSVVHAGLRLALLPALLVVPLRRWAFLGLFAIEALSLTTGLPGLGAGGLLLMLFCFDPSWAPPGQPPIQQLFYDGNCGLCHRAVRFVLAEDADGQQFRLAPLQSELLESLTTPEQRAGLPDSIVVRTPDGALFTRSEAAIRVMTRIGGLWAIVALLGRLIPRLLRDAAYDVVAAVRHKVFKRPDDACPLMPPDLRERFDY